MAGSTGRDGGAAKLSTTFPESTEEETLPLLVRGASAVGENISFTYSDADDLNLKLDDQTVACLTPASTKTHDFSRGGED